MAPGGMALPAPWFVFVLWALLATLTLSCAAMLWLHRERLGLALATAGLGLAFWGGRGLCWRTCSITATCRERLAAGSRLTTRYSEPLHGVMAPAGHTRPPLHPQPQEPSRCCAVAELRSVRRRSKRREHPPHMGAAHFIVTEREVPGLITTPRPGLQNWHPQSSQVARGDRRRTLPCGSRAGSGRWPSAGRAGARCGKACAPAAALAWRRRLRGRSSGAASKPLAGGSELASGWFGSGRGRFQTGRGRFWTCQWVVPNQPREVSDLSRGSAEPAAGGSKPVAGDFGRASG